MQYIVLRKQYPVRAIERLQFILTFPIETQIQQFEAWYFRRYLDRYRLIIQTQNHTGNFSDCIEFRIESLENPVVDYDYLSIDKELYNYIKLCHI